MWKRRKKKIELFASLVVMLAATTLANAASMNCKNPRRDYHVVFNEKSRAVILDEDTRYKVLAVEGSVVTGLTVNNGPTFRAYFKGRKRIEFFIDSKLYQVDRCR